MTICDICGELTMDSITICNECKWAEDELNERTEDDQECLWSYSEHKKGLCTVGQCRHCEEENNN